MRHLVANCAKKEMSTLNPREVKHVMRKLARLSCTKPLCQPMELQRKWDERGIKLLATVEAEGEDTSKRCRHTGGGVDE